MELCERDVDQFLLVIWIYFWLTTTYFAVEHAGPEWTTC